jgi:hypothetical protein
MKLLLRSRFDVDEVRIAGSAVAVAEDLDPLSVSRAAGIRATESADDHDAAVHDIQLVVAQQAC